MTEDNDPVTEGLRRAIAAADAANDAAEDIARLGKAQKDFVERVGTAQRRSSALATGAILGAVVCLGLSTLVYFRSVGDLHEAAELQVEAAKLVAEEVIKLKEIREGGADHEDPVAKILEGLPEAVATAVAAKLAEPTTEPAGEAQPAEAGALVAAIEQSRDEILAALAEMDMTGGGLAKPEAPVTDAPVAEGAPAAEAMPETAAVDAPAGSVDLTDIRESLARIEAGLLRITSAPAAPTSGKPAPAPAKAAPAKSAPKPSAKPAATEASPFAFP